MIVENEVNVIDKFTASKIVFHQGMSIVMDANADLLAYNIYQDSVPVKCSDSYSMVFDAVSPLVNVDSHVTKVNVKPLLNFNLICNNDSVIIRDQTQDEFSTGYFQDSVSVASATKPEIQMVDGVTFISIECQLGVYFEIEIDALSTATSVFSLPQGIRGGNRKIYGTPMHSGVYKSYLTMPSDYVIEVEFRISKTVRVL